MLLMISKAEITDFDFFSTLHSFRKHIYIEANSAASVRNGTFHQFLLIV